jgi:hypothetical protein
VALSIKSGPLKDFLWALHQQQKILDLCLYLLRQAFVLDFSYEGQCVLKINNYAQFFFHGITRKAAMQNTIFIEKAKLSFHIENDEFLVQLDKPLMIKKKESTISLESQSTLLHFDVKIKNKQTNLYTTIATIDCDLCAFNFKDKTFVIKKMVIVLLKNPGQDLQKKHKIFSVIQSIFPHLCQIEVAECSGEWLQYCSFKNFVLSQTTQQVQTGSVNFLKKDGEIRSQFSFHPPQ